MLRPKTAVCSFFAFLCLMLLASVLEGQTKTTGTKQRQPRQFVCDTDAVDVLARGFAQDSNGDWHVSIAVWDQCPSDDDLETVHIEFWTAWDRSTGGFSDFDQNFKPSKTHRTEGDVNLGQLQNGWKLLDVHVVKIATKTGQQKFYYQIGGKSGYSEDKRPGPSCHVNSWECRD